MEKVFGIISYLPDDKEARQLRVDRLNRLFKNVYNIFGEVNFIVIAQNWKDYKLGYLLDNIRNFHIFRYEKLGIVKARATLREKFLESNYDYLIMLDDDCIIEELEKDGGKKFLDELDKHPGGFSVISDKKGGYKPSQLNILAISKELYKMEPICDVDPEKDEAFEDLLWVNLLHNKYPEREFTHFYVTHTHFRNVNEKAPSTWSRTKKRNWNALRSNSNYAVDEFRRGNFDLDEIKTHFIK